MTDTPHSLLQNTTPGYTDPAVGGQNFKLLYQFIGNIINKFIEKHTR